MLDMNHDANAENLEREGRIAHLLRRLGMAESREEHGRVVEALQELTGRQFGVNLGKWLYWYLEEHLSLENAVGMLNRKLAAESTEMPNPRLLDEMVFDNAEYNWYALEKIDNKDDMVKLRMLYSDLESTLQVDAEGPFSFSRLLGLDAKELDFFRGKSLTEAIFDEQVEVRHLRHLKDYGKIMMTPLLPASTQRTGAIAYAAAISQALVRFQTKITSLSFKELAEGLASNADTILKDLIECQGAPQDFGGYYRPDHKKAEAAMRPSATLNKLIGKDF